jgi:hypothetical protein
MLHRLLLLVCVTALAACQSPPTLPPEMAPDFLFSYTMTRHDPGEIPRPEGLDEKEPGEEEAAGEEPAPAEDPAPAEGGDARDRVTTELKSIYVEIRAGKGAEYDVRFFEGGPEPKQGSIELDDDQLAAIYAAVLATGFFRLEEKYQGEDYSLPKVEYFVRSNSRLKNILVYGTKMELLENMWAEISPILVKARPGIFEHIESNLRGFVIDKRNGCFHRVDSPLVKDIPEEHRIYKPTAQACLNYGAWPSEQYNPLEDR